MKRPVKTYTRFLNERRYGPSEEELSSLEKRRKRMERGSIFPSTEMMSGEEDYGKEYHKGVLVSLLRSEKAELKMLMDRLEEEESQSPRNERAIDILMTHISLRKKAIDNLTETLYSKK